VRVTLDGGKTVDFNFKVKRKSKGNHVTTCTIVVSEEGKRSEYRGVAKCDERDSYDKATGKAKSLERALARVFPCPPQRMIRGGVLIVREVYEQNRAARKKVWTRFYETLQTPDVGYLSGCHEYM
jgi:hypothetical protein